MSIEPYWSAQHDRIFESGPTAFLVAKIWPKRFIHIWVVWRATELKFGVEAGTPKYITGTFFGAIVAILNLCDLGAGMYFVEIDIPKYYNCKDENIYKNYVLLVIIIL